MGTNYDKDKPDKNKTKTNIKQKTGLEQSSGQGVLFLFEVA